MTDNLTKLTELLREFPGIGPRQARRLTYWLLRKDRTWVEEFATTLRTTRAQVRRCERCMRMWEGPEHTSCSLCSDERRDHTQLLIVEKDVDVENIERTHAYRGRYFVLGGTATPLDREPERKVHVRELIAELNARSAARAPIQEVIFALSATADGEDTTTFLTERLKGSFTPLPFRLSTLGRGLSTGTELEYVDTETMKSALSGRQ